MQVYEVLLGCLAGIGLAVTGYSLNHRLKNFFFTRNQRKQKIRIVKESLHAALAQRSLVRLEVMRGDFKGFSAEGIFNMVTDEDMVMQITDAFGAHQWTEVPLILFFSIQHNRKTSFFHFTTEAFKAVRKGSFTELHMSLPDSISPGQKRSFLRYTPPKTDIFALGLWTMTGTTALPCTREDMEKPFLLYRPNSQNDMVLDNISAGGLRILIHERAMARASSLLEKDAHLLFLVVLANKSVKQVKEAVPAQTEPNSATAVDNSGIAPNAESAQEKEAEEKPTVSFWISCRIAMLTHVEKKNLWQIAVRFENWAPVDEKSKKIMWFPTDSNKSVPPLSSWIMRSHMEQTKKI